MRNYGKINSTKNYGNIVASSNQNKNNTSLILGGITTTNTGVIDKVENHVEFRDGRYVESRYDENGMLTASSQRDSDGTRTSASRR